MSDFSHLLIVERGTAVEDGALVIEHVVAQAVVERGAQREAFVIEVEEDVTVNVGIGVANDDLVGLVDLAVAVQVGKVNVAGLEILLGTGLVDNIEVSSLSFIRGGEHPQRLVAIEHADRVAHSGEDVVGAVDRRGIVAVSQFLHLILVMAYGSTDFHVPVTGRDGLAAEGSLETAVLHLAVVGPVVVDTADGVLKRLQGQQVLGSVEEVVNLGAQAVLQEVGLQAGVELRRGLPLDFLVTHVGKLHTYLSVVIAHGVERCAGGVVADTVVTAHVVANIEAQVVDAAVFGEPFLVGHHPA